MIPASAYVAPSAVLCGAVTLGERTRVLHGAVVTAEDGEVWIGDDVVIMENALVRGRSRNPTSVGNAVLIGPHAHINGATVEDEVFHCDRRIAVSRIGRRQRSGIANQQRAPRQLKLDPRTVVPIGWIAAGDPAQLFSPDQHEELWRVQAELDFPGTVYGVPRGTSMRSIMARQTEFYGAHRNDQIIDP